MPLPFDATLKDMVQSFTHDFETALRLTGPEPVAVLNVDLSTVSAATDIALGHGDPPVAITDLNFQSGPDPDLPDRVLLYNALFRHRFHVSVHSVVVLLRPAADTPGLTGRVRYQGRLRRGKMDFTFEVIRLWEQPVRRFLHGGLGTLPLAPLCRLPGPAPAVEALRPIIQQIDARLLREATPVDARKLLTATYVLSGLRLPHEAADLLFRGLPSMRESSTYQAILDEGRVEALQETVLSLGRIRFGAPDPVTEAAVKAVRDINRLRRLTERVLSASGWPELLQAP